MARQEDEFYVVVLQQVMRACRACFGSDREDLLHALSSNYEIDRQPPHPDDLRATVLHMAVSLYEDERKISRMARRRPERLGTHLAVLELQPDRGVCVANTSGPGHWSVWGVPATLVEFVTDVYEL